MIESPKRNLILDLLSEQDLKLIEPDLQSLDLPVRYNLAKIGEAIDWVVFLDEGSASMTSRVGHDINVELGMIGREGVVNVGVVLGSERATTNTYIQVAGSGRRIDAKNLLAAAGQSSSLHAVLLRCVHVLLAQTSSTALANARGTITERLARWLLMARDRLDHDEMPLTHDFLATMLGVRRSGVSVALRDFERHGLVLGSRGTITVLDREGLTELADGYYGAAEAQWQRMFAS